MMKLVNCKQCVWYEIFDKRYDEPTNQGCRNRDWAGYIADTETPPCVGFGFSPNNRKL